MKDFQGTISEDARTDSSHHSCALRSCLRISQTGNNFFDSSNFGSLTQDKVPLSSTPTGILGGCKPVHKAHVDWMVKLSGDSSLVMEQWTNIAPPESAVSQHHRINFCRQLDQYDSLIIPQVRSGKKAQQYPEDMGESSDSGFRSSSRISRMV